MQARLCRSVKCLGRSAVLKHTKIQILCILHKFEVQVKDTKNTARNNNAAPSRRAKTYAPATDILNRYKLHSLVLMLMPFKYKHAGPMPVLYWSYICKRWYEQKLNWAAVFPLRTQGREKLAVVFCRHGDNSWLFSYKEPVLYSSETPQN